MRFPRSWNRLFTSRVRNDHDFKVVGELSDEQATGLKNREVSESYESAARTGIFSDSSKKYTNAKAERGSMPDGSGPTASDGWLTGRFLGEKTVQLLRNRGFRLLYLGRAVGRIGDKLYFLAAMWLVFELTGSSFYTGIAGFLSRLPQAIGFVFGPFVDRSRLGRLMVGVEGAQGIVVLAVPVAWYFDVLNVFVVLGILPILTLLRRISAPAEQAALPRLVDDELLGRANSLDSATDQSLGALAQGLGGALIAILGAVTLYVINSVTFFVTALLYALLDVPATEATGTSPTWQEYVADVREGIDLIRLSIVGHMVIAASLAGVFTSMATAVLPAFASTFGGAETYGLLVGSVTLGMLVGSFAATFVESFPLGYVTIAGFFVATIARIGAVVVEVRLLALALFGGAAIPVGVYSVLSSTTIQIGVPNDMLARVSSTIGSLTAVLGPLGFLVGGYLGDRLGSDVAIAVSAMGFLLVSIYWASISNLRTFPSVNELDADSFGLDADG